VVSATESVRPTGESAYVDGTGTFKAAKRIVSGAALRGDRTVAVDACVIGSGAGGAVVAKELAEGGLRVAILEEGDWWETDSFDARPREMMRRLYRDAGQIATLGTPSIVLPLGIGVGGTTIVNSGTCFRTPARVLERWRREFGLEQLDPESLEPYFRRVERQLNVSQVPARIAGPNATLVRRGAEALGLSGDYLYRNVRGCVGSGVCAYGCPTGAKQHVGIVFIPRAWAAGATTYTLTRAQRLVVEGGRVREVLARTGGGGRLRITCEHAIVACGALHTPLLLARSGVGARCGQLGRNLSIHPATAVRAVFDEPARMWDGVPQSYYVDALADEGIMLEGIAGPPDHLAFSTPRVGVEHRELLLAAERTSMFGVMVSDESRGRVRSVFGRPQVRYDLVDRDVARFKRGIEALTDIYWAAGARQVVVPIAGVPTLREGDSQPLQRHPIAARDLYLMAFHPLGSARAGADPRHAVVDGDLRVHGIEGLYVVDGSVVPSSLGVNPQITIMALATRLGYHLVGSPAPTDEPRPERIA
jgi:choline dehydrogenase-like flavoprotein